MWHKFLEQNQNDPYDIYTMRYEQIENHVKSKNPRLKGRLLGVFLVVLGVAMGLIVGRVAIYGPFGS
jgi:hypothetical protein